MLAGIRHQAALKNITLEKQGTFHHSLYADRVRIKEILYNLLSNAVKFTPERGRVWIESSNENGVLQVSVCDTGVGIPEAEHAAVFEKFYQARNSKSEGSKGTGLGLPITRHLVELHGGTISLASRLGEGSRFILSLPIVKTSES